MFLSPPQTIDFELRKLDAQQAAEHINLLKSFMPNTFLISGGEPVSLVLHCRGSKYTLEYDFLMLLYHLE